MKEHTKIEYKTWYERIMEALIKDSSTSDDIGQALVSEPKEG